jgi:transglutaminase-like putative cysteine protease
MTVNDGRSERSVTARLEADVTEPADVAVAIAVADGYQRTDERLAVTLDGDPIEVGEIAAAHGGRLHVVKNARRGRLVVTYEVVVCGSAPTTVVSELDRIRYLRPSRYCESDRLGPLARAEFEGLEGADLLDGVSSWVGANIDYVPGSSRPIDGALATLLSREGVCRDFAHLTAALLRANNVPSRVVSVYAPGLEPMDFHAVTEANLGDAWYVVDATCLAPRSSMVRIATGADASDTAFLSILHGGLVLGDLTVSAVTQSLPSDDVTDLVRLG